jgi:hypothetical protein
MVASAAAATVAKRRVKPSRFIVVSGQVRRIDDCTVVAGR